MSTESYKVTESSNVLYATGRLTTTMNFNWTARMFYPIQTFDLSTFDQNRLGVYVFGNVNDDGSGIFPPVVNYVVQPHTFGGAFIYNSASGGSRADSDYQLVNGILSIGIRSISDIAETILPPYYQASVDYFIFYY